MYNKILLNLIIWFFNFCGCDVICDWEEEKYWLFCCSFEIIGGFEILVVLLKIFLGKIIEIVYLI